jgi:hypothetical protein
VTCSLRWNLYALWSQRIEMTGHLTLLCMPMCRHVILLLFVTQLGRKNKNFKHLNGSLGSFRFIIKKLNYWFWCVVQHLCYITKGMKSVEVDGNQIKHNKEAMNAHWKIHVELVHHALKITVMQVVLNLILCVFTKERVTVISKVYVFIYIYFLSFFLSSLEESNKKDTL